jgi:hypothetical protein
MYASIGLQGLGAAKSISGAYEEADAKSKYYGYLAGQTEQQIGILNNSNLTEQKLVQDQAARDSKRLNNEGKKVAASQNAGMAANGIALNSATAEDVAVDSFDREKMDELAVRYSADMKNWDLENQRKIKTWDLKNQAYQYRLSGRMAEDAGRTNATTSLLNGATSVAGTWLNYKTKT